MKRETFRTILLIAVVLIMMVALTACKKDENIGKIPENVEKEQSSGSVNLPDIPPGAVKERQEEGSQTFKIDLDDPNSGSFSHSFSIDESDMDGSHSVSVDEYGNIIEDDGE